MATRNARRKPATKPEQQAQKPEEGEAVKPEPAASEPEKPDYARLEVLAAEEAANGEDWKPGVGESEKPKKPAGVGSKELMALYQMSFALAAVRLGAHWQLSEEEASELSHATDAVLEKYGAKMAMGPEVTLVITAGMVTVPRILLTASQAGRKTEEKPEPGNEETGLTDQAGEGAPNGGE